MEGGKGEQGNGDGAAREGSRLCTAVTVTRSADRDIREGKDGMPARSDHTSGIYEDQPYDSVFYKHPYEGIIQLISMRKGDNSEKEGNGKKDPQTGKRPADGQEK